MFEDIYDALDDAQAVIVDQKNGVIMVWRGGPHIRAYDAGFNAVAHWYIESEKELTRKQVLANMRQHMKENNYPN